MEIIKKEFYNYKAEEQLDQTGLTLDLIVEKLGLKPEEIEENIKNLHFDRPENSLEVDRLLTDEERALAKERILEIQLDELPELQEKKAEIDFKAKQMMKEAADLVNAKIAESRTQSEYLKNGIESEFIEPSKLFRVLINDFFVTFYVTEAGPKVVKIQKNSDSFGLNKLHDESIAMKNEAFFGFAEERKVE